jgi:Molybdopterin-binding domain of aldehyde dehydrogenase/2Fe-2S iron-sulfur cluster binding domain
MSEEECVAIAFTVNGTRIHRSVPVRQHLVDFLRIELGLTGAHLGCEDGVCGACSVRVDGAVVRGCLMPGDTDAVPYGGGTFGSCAVAIGGEAVRRAACDLRQEILVLAGQLLQADPAGLDIVEGAVVGRVSGAKRLPLAEIGRIGHFQLAELPRGTQPALSHTRRFHLADDLYIFTNGVHGAHVEVDTDTGFVKLLKHWVVEDCGRVINPQLADEQVRGGCVQSLGGALYEHCIYDQAGQLVNGTMVNHLVPMAAEMPDIDVAHVGTPTSASLLGAKGVGESGTGAASGRGHERHQRGAAALQGACDDAADHTRGDPDRARQNLTRRRCGASCRTLLGARSSCDHQDLGECHDLAQTVCAAALEPAALHVGPVGAAARNDQVPEFPSRTNE